MVCFQRGARRKAEGVTKIGKSVTFLSRLLSRRADGGRLAQVFSTRRRRLNRARGRDCHENCPKRHVRVPDSVTVPTERRTGRPKRLLTGLGPCGLARLGHGVATANSVRLASGSESGDECSMRDLLSLIRWMLLGRFRSKASLEAEILALRHQLNVLRRTSPRRAVFSNFDRMIFVCLYRIAPRILDAITIVEPETVIRWHRAGFRSFWRWKSRRRAGRPSVPPEIRRLIREISLANPLWGAPRIHGELLKLSIDVGQTSVAKYMARRRRPPSQGWRTFLLNHADGIASIDLFVVPTISFKLLYGLLILRHDRRRILWIGVTRSPTSEWIARQVSEACGWEPVPDYLVRDRDRVYG